MKKTITLLAVTCLMQISANAQLTVTATAASPSICFSNSTSISATATPVGYTVTSIPNDPQPVFGTNVLADAGTAVTTLSTGNLNDGRWDGIALPFPFTFYGNTFNTIHVSTNGWIGMGNTNSTTTGINFSLPSGSAPNNVIHAITASLNFSAAGTIEYDEGGTYPYRMFFVNFANIPFTSGLSPANVQVILYETTNVIEIHTSDCSNITLPKLQGIENSTGSVYSVVPGRNNTASWSGTGMPNAYRFTPDNITFSWSPSTGLNTTTDPVVIASPTTTTTYTVNALNTVNSATGLTTVTVTINPASNTLAAVAGGPQICQNISVAGGGTYYRDGNCNLISSIVPAGANPVSNSINTCIKLDAGSSKRGTTNLYGARRYDIEPIVNPATSTANITLYYPQSDFNDFNTRAADSGHRLLPANAADATGISNLVIRQFHGAGTAPGNYPGASQDFITPTSGYTIVWNAGKSWWEVTVPVTGFSGFYLTSKKTGTLAIGLDYFKGVQINKKHSLSWKVNCTSAQATFEVMRSADGQHYTAIKTITADQLRCSQPFEFTDEEPLNGSNYYRIRIIDTDGKDAMSNIVLLSMKISRFEMKSLSPNVINTENAVLKINSGDKNELRLVITDFTGRSITTEAIHLQPGMNQTIINTGSLAKGIYQVTGYYPGERPQTLRMVKR